MIIPEIGDVRYDDAEPVHVIGRNNEYLWVKTPKKKPKTMSLDEWNRLSTQRNNTIIVMVDEQCILGCKNLPKGMSLEVRNYDIPDDADYYIDADGDRYQVLGYVDGAEST